MTDRKTLLVHLPNILTILNMATGFLALLFTTEGYLRTAAFLVLLAVVLDYADGLSARLLSAESSLGAELDSLADIISFGIAPALLMYFLLRGELMPEDQPSGFSGLPLVMQLILCSPVLLVAACGYRLARFNTSAGSRVFSGLPVPAAGIFVAGLILCVTGPSVPAGITNPIQTVFFLLASIFLLSLLMVSRLPLLSLKMVSWRLKDNLIIWLFLLVSLLSLMIMHEPAVPLIIVLYLLFSLLNNLTTTKA